MLLYKDARVDMDVLDDTVGVEGWSRTHEVVNGNMFCSVCVKFGDSWVCKQDVGVPSNQASEKGEASDAFKRACVNWGIGRELYTPLFIWVSLKQGETYKGNNGKLQLSNRLELHVSSITTQDGVITSLQISDKSGKSRYTYGGGNKQTTNPKRQTKKNKAPIKSVSNLQWQVIKEYQTQFNLNDKQLDSLCKRELKYSVEMLDYTGADVLIKFFKAQEKLQSAEQGRSNA